MKILQLVGLIGCLAFGSVIADYSGFPQVGYVLLGFVILSAILASKR